MFTRALSILALCGLSTSAFAATCDIFPTSSCSSSSGVSVSSGTTPAGDLAAVATVNMSGYQRLDVFAYVCDPTGWALHLADSPSDNGYGGDASTTDHDAEAYLFDGYDLHFYSAQDVTRSLFPSIAIINDAINPDSFDSAGCGVVQLAFVNGSSTSANSQVVFDGDATGAYDAPDLTLSSVYGPRLGYAATTSTSTTTRGVETDYEDRALSDRYKWYVGVNRVVQSALSRYGSGVEEACIVMSTTTAEPSSCL